jgi:hypothetical protein
MLTFDSLSLEILLLKWEFSDSNNEQLPRFKYLMSLRYSKIYNYRCWHFYQLEQPTVWQPDGKILRKTLENSFNSQHSTGGFRFYSKDLVWQLLMNAFSAPRFTLNGTETNFFNVKLILLSLMYYWQSTIWIKRQEKINILFLK